MNIKDINESIIHSIPVLGQILLINAIPNKLLSAKNDDIEYIKLLKLMGETDFKYSGQSLMQEKFFITGRLTGSIIGLILGSFYGYFLNYNIYDVILFGFLFSPPAILIGKSISLVIYNLYAKKLK